MRAERVGEVDGSPGWRGGAGPRVVIVPSVFAAPGDGGIFLDDKAISGLATWHRDWPGPVRAIFRRGPQATISFGRLYDPQALGFEIALADAEAPIPDALIADADIILAGGDDIRDFPMLAQARRLGVAIVYIIENLLRTRLQINASANIGAWQTLKSAVWAAGMELRRRRIFRGADGLQANGTPAADLYGRINPQTLCFFDTRLPVSMMADDAAMATRADRLRGGRPLRLAFTGRLEALKGADHLVPVARELAARGIAFHLDIFGTGSQSDAIGRAIGEAGLGDRVTLHGGVDFETRLMPYLREQVDLFVCCHRQSDPSCTYLETFGCGVPMVAYENLAFDGIVRLAPVGWSVRRDDPAAMADRIATLDRDREALCAAAIAARRFAGQHDMSATFAARQQHLLGLLDHAGRCAA
ncbi:Glycosyl transferases group 1 [Sphingomonas laterariae]|uniref:Glycosyl transferases group 1 n=1 Tax=Edaphosphingomonas laterariae TaxID=861865 RepID=A0A239ECX2_9SPHN|nr:glycosyltransferase [Sphingomonas laterariae]SNS42457.1 Glycosyl transferases group 1 [Sphingomonas laterariae]